MVQRSGLDGDGLPALGRGRVGALAELQPGQRVIGIKAGGGDSEHAGTLTRPAGSMRHPAKGSRKSTMAVTVYCLLITRRNSAVRPVSRPTGDRPPRRPGTVTQRPAA